MHNNKILEITKQNKELENRLSDLKNHHNNLRAQLSLIQESRAYKIWQKYNQIKKYCITVIRKPKLLIKAIKILITHGPMYLLQNINNRNLINFQQNSINDQYQIWFSKNYPTKNTLFKQIEDQKLFKYRPIISIIVPIFNTDEKYLKACIQSVKNQTYDKWELCLADDNSTTTYIKNFLNELKKSDSRIKIVFRKNNGHISNASNSALKLTTGEFVALLDHDDELAPNALFEVVKTLNDQKDLDLIYSDEDKIDLNGKHVDPFFKPDWSPDMFLSTNYLCHLTVIRKKIIDKVGQFRTGFEGSQDYDLLLRITENTKNITHISKILYSWRKIPGSTASEYSVKDYANKASIKALTEALERRKIKGIVKNGLVAGTFRIKYELVNKPLISIIIPTKDKIEYLKKCVEGIIYKTTYDNYEIIIIDSGSKQKEAVSYLNDLEKNINIKILHWKKIFNYSAVNNFAVQKSLGKFIVLLNNDTEIISSSWIEAMLEHAQRKEVGAVGAKLLYPDNTIQHAGIILGIKGGDIEKGVAGHAMKTYPDIPLKDPLLNSKDLIKNYSAVTAACLMIDKKKYFEVDGLDENFRIAFNDVDFCLKLLKKGYYNVYTPYSKLYHYESVTVKKINSPTRNMKEFNNEIHLLRKKWQKDINNDQFYNNNLSKNTEMLSIKIND